MNLTEISRIHRHDPTRAADLLRQGKQQQAIAAKPWKAPTYEKCRRTDYDRLLADNHNLKQQNKTLRAQLARKGERLHLAEHELARLQHIQESGDDNEV